jgi:hypothetical protein
MPFLTKGVAVSLIAIPLGFASCLATIWLTGRYSLNEAGDQGDEQSNLTKYLNFEKNLTMDPSQRTKYIWKTFEGVIIILSAAKDLLCEFITSQQVQKFSDILTTLQHKQFTRSYCQTNLIPKVIVLEGLPQNGVSTLVNQLTNTSQVKHCPKLDDCFLELIKKRNQFPLSLRNAFDLFCDYYRYSLAEDLSLRESCFVVLDRFYHSTCVQQLRPLQNKEIKLDEIPSHVYQWPLDLPSPLLVSSTAPLLTPLTSLTILLSICLKFSSPVFCRCLRSYISLSHWRSASRDITRDHS